MRGFGHLSRRRGLGGGASSSDPSEVEPGGVRTEPGLRQDRRTHPRPTRRPEPEVWGCGAGKERAGPRHPLHSSKAWLKSPTIQLRGSAVPLAKAAPLGWATGDFLPVAASCAKDDETQLGAEVGPDRRSGSGSQMDLSMEFRSDPRVILKTLLLLTPAMPAWPPRQTAIGSRCKRR